MRTILLGLLGILTIWASELAAARPEFAYADYHAELPSEVFNTDRYGDGEMARRREKNVPLNQQPNCPATLETLTSLLLKDLPSYANRVIERSRQFDRSINDARSYVILAGKPEFEPLKLSQQQYTPLFPESSQQLFFTTLERQYFGNRVIQTENYHWVFLTQTEGGWRLVMMFSQLGSSVKEKPPLPPRESSNGAIGQAIQLWLRDCRAGAIRIESL